MSRSFPGAGGPPPATPPASLLALDVALADVLGRPRTEQPAAVRDWTARYAAEGEVWNTAFGGASRFEAFTGSRVAQGVYTANRDALRPVLSRRGWRVLEVGGGNGALWRGFLPDDAEGTIVVVDPHPEGAEGVRAAVPAGVRVEHVAAGVEVAELPQVDAAVASLVLHHVAGADAEARAAVGIAGPGKHEALVALSKAVGRDGLLLVNEADVYCDLALPPGDALLAERIVDSYVRRFAVSLRDDAWRAADAGDALAATRLADVAWAWGLGQIAVADATFAARDVYELDVVGWIEVFRRAGLAVPARGCTDAYGLFWRYLLRAA
jgi:hypothetical protein